MTVKRSTGAACMERLWGKTDKKQEMASTAASKKTTGGPYGVPSGCSLFGTAEF